MQKYHPKNHFAFSKPCRGTAEEIKICRGSMKKIKLCGLISPFSTLFRANPEGMELNKKNTM